MTGTDQNLKEQASQIQSINGVRQQFHPPVSSNYVFMLVPATVDLDQFSRDWVQQTNHLNQADRSLLVFCCEHLRQHPDFCGSIIARKWNQCITERVNLKGGRWANMLMERIANNGSIDSTFGRHIQQRAPQVVDSFLSIPDAITRIIRLNAYMNESEKLVCLEKIMQLRNQIPVDQFIDRLEISKAMATAEGQRTYPRLIVYVKRDALNDREMFRNCITQLGSVFQSLKNQRPARLDYALKWRSNCTVTEGFALYKRYLDKLEIIERLYSTRTNFGLTQDSRLENLLTFPT